MIAYFDCVAGISGDMTLGALIDLGLPKKVLLAELGRLGLGGYRLSARRTSRHGIGGTRLRVVVDEPGGHHRSLADIVRMIDASGLSENVKEMSRAVFTRLAKAEAKVHRCRVHDVHFHEVGAVDSIVDIVGVAIGLEFLEIDGIFASRVPVGSGFVACRHGNLPVPAPATVELLRGIPVTGTGIACELVTPTGAAILATLVDRFDEIPEMVLDRAGYGIGSRELDEIPNVLRILLGRADASFPGDCVDVIECEIDDMIPECYEPLMERLFDAGALDVTFAPVQMKKNRPGTRLQVLARGADRPRLAEVVLRESSSIGLRYHTVGRTLLRRKTVVVATAFGPIGVKVSGDRAGKIEKAAPEYEDCKRAADAAGVPVAKVREAALVGLAAGKGRGRKAGRKIKP